MGISFAHPRSLSWARGEPFPATVWIVPAAPCARAWGTHEHPSMDTKARQAGSGWKPCEFRMGGTREIETFIDAVSLLKIELHERGFSTCMRLRAPDVFAAQRREGRSGTPGWRKCFPPCTSERAGDE